MAGFRDYIPNLSLSWKYILIIATVGLLIAAVIYVYYNYLSPKLSPTYVANKEFNKKGVDNIVELTMFTVDWCPYCKKAKPIWDDFSNQYEDKSVNGYTLKFKTVNCTNEKDPNVKNVLNKYDIEGYPTIKMFKDGEMYNFDAKPTVGSLENFVNTLLN